MIILRTQAPRPPGTVLASERYHVGPRFGILSTGEDRPLLGEIVDAIAKGRRESMLIFIIGMFVLLFLTDLFSRVNKIIIHRRSEDGGQF